MVDEVLPARIVSQSNYVIFSAHDGLISEHSTGTEAIQEFARFAARHIDTDAQIYKHEDGRWLVF